MKLKVIVLLILVVSSFMFLSCQEEQTNMPQENTNELRGVYMGQTPPAENAIRFAPNNTYLSTSDWCWQDSPTFSPNGKEMYFVKYLTRSDIHEVWYTRCVDGIWSEAEKAPFSKGRFTSNPIFLHSNDTLYYYSRNTEEFIFRVTRTSDGWSEPTSLEIPIPENHMGLSFYISNNKSVYFSMMNTSSNNFKTNYLSADIYLSRLVNGQYTQPKKISTVSNANIGEEIDYVEPNEQYFLYSTKKSDGFGLHDIYISYKKDDDNWDTPLNLGPKINSSHEDSYVSITPDGKYLFFITQKLGDRGYTPYWIDAGVIID